MTLQDYISWLRLFWVINYKIVTLTFFFFNLVLFNFSTNSSAMVSGMATNAQSGLVR